MIYWVRSVLQPARAIACFKQWFLDVRRALGPIFRIEAMLAVRRARYYLLRAGYCALLLFIMWICYQGAHEGGAATMTLQSTARFATSFFYSFASAQFVVAMVVTAAVTAGTIAEERERRTIEYLFSTDLSNSEIVLGKLAARLLLVLVFLMAGLPVLSLALLFGGIDAGNLLQLFLVTASTVAASASLSMFISVWARRPREAVTRAFIILLGLVVVPWLALFLPFLRPAIYEWTRPVIDTLTVANPFVFLVVMANVGLPLPASPSPGWRGVGELATNHAFLSLAVLALAIWRLRRVHLRESGRPASSAGSPHSWRLFRPRLGACPMVWKELFAEQAVSGMGIVSRLIVVLVVLAILAPLVRQFWRTLIGVYRPDDFRELISVLVSIISSVMLIVLSARSATSVTTEKERQSWETLLSTPLSSWEIVLGKTVGNLFAFRWVVALFAVLWGMAVFLLPRAITGALLMTGTIAALCPMFVGIGLFFSLRSRGSTRAMCWSLLTSLFIGGGYLLFATPLIGMLVRSGVIGRQQENSIVAGCAPYLISWASNPEVRRPPDGISTGLFLAGVGGHLIVGAGILLQNVRAFDRLAGRPRHTRLREDRSRTHQSAAGFAGKEELRFSGEMTG